MRTPVNLERPSRPPGPQPTTPPRGFALPRLARLIVEVFPRCVGLVLLWAASLKVWNEAPAARVLEFAGLPEPLVGPAVSLIVLVETALGLLLILRPKLPWVLGGTVSLLALYTAQLAYLAAYRDAPNCACLAAWANYHAARVDNLMGIGRNVCLILALLWVRAQSNRPVHSASGDPTPGAPRDRGG